MYSGMIGTRQTCKKERKTSRGWQLHEWGLGGAAWCKAREGSLARTRGYLAVQAGLCVVGGVLSVAAHPGLLLS